METTFGRLILCLVHEEGIATTTKEMAYYQSQ